MGVKAKGHTTIELTDVNTGEVEVYEDDNLVTDFAFDLFKTGWKTNIGYVRGYSGSSDSNQIKDTFKWGFPISIYFGGIQAFDVVVPETGFEPATNAKTIAASWMGSTDNTNYPTNYGTFNTNESGFSIDENGKATARFVYDFGTDRGNGKIASVCLCNPANAGCGYGNPDGNYIKVGYDSQYIINASSAGTGKASNYTTRAFNYKFRICESMDSTHPTLSSYGGVTFKHPTYKSEYANKIAPLSYVNSRVVKVDRENNIVYVINNANLLDGGSPTSLYNGKLEILKFYYPTSSANPMCVDVYDTTAFSSDTYSYVGSEVIDTPSNFRGANMWQGDLALDYYRYYSEALYVTTDYDLNIYIVTCKTSSGYNAGCCYLNSREYSGIIPGDTIEVWKLNQNFQTVWSKTITVPTNTYLLVPTTNTNDNNATKCAILDNKLYLVGLDTTFSYRHRTGDDSAEAISGDRQNCCGVYKIDLDNPTDIVKIENSSDAYQYANKHKLGGRWIHLFTFGKNVYFSVDYNDNGDTWRVRRIDPINNTAYYINYELKPKENDSFGNFASSLATLFPVYNNSKESAINFANYVWDNGSGRMLQTISTHFDRLTTINNLEKAVTKTADKTMKITYTLQIDTTPFADIDDEVFNED